MSQGRKELLEFVRGTTLDEAPRSAAQEHGGLLVLWFVALAGLVGALASLVWGTSAPAPLPTVFLSMAGLAFGALVVRMVVVGYTGYERAVGLRIILRQGGERAYLRGIVSCVALVVGGALSLVVLGEPEVGSHAADPSAWEQGVRLAALVVVAISTFAGLLLIIARYFSVFGTTSIVCTVIGVAALVVVQSVGTGFLHEFERRVTGVYAHINVTRVYGLSEYRRFEQWLRGLPGVTGASPFVYYVMAMAPEDQDGRREGQVRPATVLVKGIDPGTGPEVIDIEAHLRRASGEGVSTDALAHSVTLRPVLDRPDLPAVLADIEDPRGADWFERAQEEWDASRRGATSREGDDGWGDDGWSDDAWVDPPVPMAASDAAKVRNEAPEDPAIPTMFVGKYLAERLSLQRGDVVRLVDPGGAFDTTAPPRFRKFKVEGVFEAGFQEYDERLVYVHIRELQAFRFRDSDMVSGVDLRLSDPNDAPEVGAMIREELRGGYQVLEWQELNRTLFSSIRQQKNVITIVLSLVIFVAGFNVLSALWTMVVRRTPEVAILMSMGGTPAQIARVFQVTGMTIGLAGAVAGIAFGLVLCWLVQLYGYTLDPQVYFIESLPVEVSPLQILLILVLALAICFVATIPPALRAAWQRPVDGLRYE